MTVFFEPTDQPTVTVLEYFQNYRLRRVTWNWQPLVAQRLFRRAVGRNMAALSTSADWLWFADADMVFRESCLDSLSTTLSSEATAILVYPRLVNISRSHEIGEQSLARVGAGPAIVDIDPGEFVRHRYRRAIGGVQIVPGKTARETGYCNNYRRLSMAPTTFGAFADDARFRRSLGTPGIPIDVVDLYRIRHLNRWLPTATLQTDSPPSQFN